MARGDRPIEAGTAPSRPVSQTGSLPARGAPTRGREGPVDLVADAVRGIAMHPVAGAVRSHAHDAHDALVVLRDTLDDLVAAAG